MRHFAFSLLPLLWLVSLVASAQGIIRHKLPNNNTFPISAAVEISPGKSIIYLSGMVAPVSNPNAVKGSVAAYGDTKTQTIGALNAIKTELRSLHLVMGDVVKMHVFLAGDTTKGGKMDFIGFM